MDNLTRKLSFFTKAKSNVEPKMAPNLTIRNISNNVLELVTVEYFDPHQHEGGFQFGNVTKTFANVTNAVGLTNTTTRAHVPQISSDTQPFERRDVSVRIEPFTAVATDIAPTINKSDERLRLTFQVDGGATHQMYCPVPTTESASLQVVGDDDHRRYTGIYLTHDSHVTLYNSSELNRWQASIPDQTPLGALSIPGTHNSPTCHLAPPSVRCQAVSPLDQLQNGVRFFDIRVQVPEPFNVESDKLVLVHAVFPISLTGNKHFRDLHDMIRRFLIENPSETLIMSLKREGAGKGTDEQLSQILRRHYITNNDEWYSEPRVPSLSQARGKIVLVRRFNLAPELHNEWSGRGWGIDGSVWADNTPNALCASGDLCIQDFYEVMEDSTIDQKITYARDHLERSGACVFPPERIANHDGTEKFPLYVNFLSASNFWKVGTWPEKVAARLNPSVTEHLCKNHMLEPDGRVRDGDWSTGIVVCDWVGMDGDWDLVRCVVGMNAKLIR